MKDFYMSALLPAGAVWKGKTLTAAETLSPLAESLIIEKWLSKIHPNLPAHVKKTRGHLFTDRTPTLGCNQVEICKQIDIMLNEMEKEGSPASLSRFGPPRPPFYRPPYQQNRYFAPRPSASRPFPRQPFPSNSGSRPTTQTSYPCPLCIQAGKPENVARSHSYANCQFTQPRGQPRRPPNRSAMRLVMVPDEQSQDLHQDPSLLNEQQPGNDWTQQGGPYFLPEQHDQVTQLQPNLEILPTSYGPPPAMFGLPDHWEDPYSF